MMNTRIVKIGLMVALGWTSPQVAAATGGTIPQEIRQNDPKKHTVQAGETLYAISRMYNVSVNEIQSWNSLESTELSIGQTLIVSPPEKKPEEPVKEVLGDGDELTEVIPEKPRQPAVIGPRKTHTVVPGETLYGIARLHDVDVKTIKRLNKLADANISVGQVLKLVPDDKVQARPTTDAAPSNPNQGTGLMTMIKDTVEETPIDNVEIEMDVLKVNSEVKIAPGAKVEDYKDGEGKRFKRVTETGLAGKIDDFSTDQTKFYAFHKYLPVGSYIRIDYPERSQSILCEVRSQLGDNDDHVVRLTAKCMEYLRLGDEGGEVLLRYVVPIN